MIKCGIYKITNPKNKIYVGQAVNIDKRWNEYNINNTNLQKQPKVYRSISKYGIEAHKFEIIEECHIEQLNEREIYWGEFFNVLGENGLNLKLGNSGGKCSEETKLKISEGLNGIKRSDETKNKISKSMKGKVKTKNHIDNIIKGKSNISEETKLKMSKSLTGKKLGKASIGSGRKPGFKTSEETKQKQSLIKVGKSSNHKGYKDSNETLIKKSLAKKEKPSSKKGKIYGKQKNPHIRLKKGSNRNTPITLLNLDTNQKIYYNSISELQESFNLSSWKCYQAVKHNKIINNYKIINHE